MPRLPGNALERSEERRGVRKEGSKRDGTEERCRRCHSSSTTGNPSLAELPLHSSQVGYTERSSRRRPAPVNAERSRNQSRLGPQGHGGAKRLMGAFERPRNTLYIASSLNPRRCRCRQRKQFPSWPKHGGLLPEVVLQKLDIPNAFRCKWF